MITSQALSDREFHQFRELMHRVAGIDLAETKKPLVSGRLIKRLQALGLASFGDYFHLVSGGRAPEEFHQMVDLLTTHETHFFREPRHFDLLSNHVLPALTRRSVRFWSAASSTGEEAYSLAMLLMDHFGESVDWRILASDISLDVLRRAESGIYDEERVAGISPDYRRRYLLRGVGSRAGTLRIVPELRQRVRFTQINLNEPIGAHGPFEVVFLRNVLIYFNIQKKQEIVRRVLSRMHPDGWLFIGHSESLNGITDEVQQVAPTVYKRR